MADRNTDDAVDVRTRVNHANVFTFYHQVDFSRRQRTTQLAEQWGCENQIPDFIDAHHEHSSHRVQAQTPGVPVDRPQPEGRTDHTTQ